MLTRPLARLTILLSMTALFGCSTAKTVDVLESRLRNQEDMLANYETEITRVKSELSATRGEAEDLRLQLADAGQPMMPAEESGALFRTTGIQFSALMTGGTDVDGEPGHDALSVVLVPHDHGGELVKLPGNIEIEAFDLSQPGGAQRIGQWTFDQREVHQYWHKGVIQSGYQFELPWQTPPQSDKVLLVAHLSAANGRKFDTNLTVKIDPPTGHFAGSPRNRARQSVAGRDNPYAVEQAAAAAAHSDIIWADGEGPAAERRMTADGPVGFTRRPSAATFGTSPFDRENDSRTDPAQARAMTGSQFSRDLDRASPLHVQPSTSLRGRSSRPPSSFGQQQRASSPQSAGPHPSAEGFGFPIGSPPWDYENPGRRNEPAASPVREVPPPIEDWWDNDDWATGGRAADESAVRTSDAFTDESMPQYR